ncbi:MAG: GNAT family N-acetyltransferase [Cyclobacteriaceae bacterium]|nr:GNAT family N-acetyltransferase [Cyclobacteriaceae bacterium]MCH8515682.1 GNAT family N-acetyltransferase [Cyclobacteriaceae bacterium]
MQDMIVNLEQIKWDFSEEEKLQSLGIIVRKPIAPELDQVSRWIANHFSAYWSCEAQVAFSKAPVGMWVAQRAVENELVGFACFDCTARGFFGPTGVSESARGKGIGKALLLRSLFSLKELGYAYAIIGGVGPFAYYEKVVGAQIIAGSERNIYNHMLRYPKNKK